MSAMNNVKMQIADMTAKQIFEVLQCSTSTTICKFIYNQLSPDLQTEIDSIYDVKR